GRDAERRGDRPGGGDVDQKGAHRHRRPHARPEEKKRRERNAGWGPHRGGARVNEGEMEPELAGENIERGEGGEPRPMCRRGAEGHDVRAYVVALLGQGDWGHHGKAIVAHRRFDQCRSIFYYHTVYVYHVVWRTWTDLLRG